MHDGGQPQTSKDRRPEPTANVELVGVVTARAG
jgi:hypothetical protein